MPSKRACDCCNIRKVKCNGQQPCHRCSQHDLQCTYLRTRRKSGPNRLRPSSLAKIEDHQRSSSACHLGQQQQLDFPSPSPSALDAWMPPPLPVKVTLSALTRVLRIYQDHLYGIWPLLNAEELIAQMERNPHNPETHTLAAAICGATLSHLNQTVYDDSECNDPNLPQMLTADSFAQQARRLRGTFDYMEHVTLNSVLTSYFLHIYYGRRSGREQTAAFYIREAITFANLLDMHIETTYVQPQWTPRERQVMRKLYFLLLMTERFLCIRYGLPTVLEPIALPSTDNEDYPDLVTGFLNLVTLFHTPGSDFFNKWTAQGTSVSLSSKQLLLIQRELELPTEIPQCANDIQKVDIVATQHWIRSLIWKLSIQSGYVAAQAQPGRREMSVSYPVRIAQDALAGLELLPISAFEVHGPGMETKIYEITDALADSILCQEPVEDSSGMVVGPRETLQALSNLLFSTAATNSELRSTLTQKLDRVFELTSIPPVVENEADPVDDSVIFQNENDNCLPIEFSPLLTADFAALISCSGDNIFPVE
ncbi:BglR [Penicillium lagena]|uniref:BglR n=1 Tax=Penicillium lagena TaxID=94218 RepID=UPI002540393D|nr:BglR [Penicillium lagena]KAJ5610289.1 BglR [Penicillium lagena]